MKCPHCGQMDNGVIDSRVSKDGTSIRRRRECAVCKGRFTTYEHIHIRRTEKDLSIRKPFRFFDGSVG